MPSVINTIFLLLCAAVATLVAQTAPATQTAPAAQAKPDARTQQQAALDAMRDSLAKQRAAIQKQVGAESSGFFLLPPPAAFPPVADCDPLPAAEIDGLIARASVEAHVDGALIRGVMRQESAFRPCAISSKGAMGLMQLMPATAAQFGVRDAFDPAENTSAGARFLKELLDRYSGDVPKVLAAYNAGPTTVDEADGIPQIPETLNYIQRILPFLPQL